METSSAAELQHQIGALDDVLVRISVFRRQPWYRQLLVEGTGLDGRITTMRLLRALDQLSRTAPGPSIRELAERLVMEQSNVSRAVDQAVEQGLIEKRQSPKDGRRTLLSLTERGERAIRELDVRRDRLYTQLVDDWDVAELANLVRLLSRLADSYERLGGPTPAGEQEA